MSIEKKLFETLPCGRSVYAYTLANHSGTSVRVMNLGGTLLNIWVKDKNGKAEDVICGYDEVDTYLHTGGYQGALIGRYGNRIGNACFTLDGKTYHLYKNDGENHLHGGKNGFDKKLWTVTEAGNEEEPSLILNCVSPDGEESYPGTLTVTVIYTLTAKGALSIHYLAMTDAATILNLTNHSYFNLSGYQNGNIGTHTLWMDACAINGLGAGLIPDGTILPVDGTPYDFRTEKSVGDSLAADHPMVRELNGFDNNFIFADYDGKLKLRALLRHPASGRTMRMYTDQPCVQLYTANMIDESAHPFKNNVPQKKHCALCLETQAMPDSINHPGFTNVILRPGEAYDRTTIYEFTAE